MNGFVIITKVFSVGQGFWEEEKLLVHPLCVQTERNITFARQSFFKYTSGIDPASSARAN